MTAKGERKKKITFLIVKVAAGALLFLCCLFIFGYLVHEVLVEKEAGFDTAILRQMDKFRKDAIVPWVEFITFFGSMWFLLPAYCILMVICYQQNKKSLAIDIGIVGLSSTILLHSLKYYFERNRPEDQLVETLLTFSFPSGHALSSFIFCSTLVYIVWKTRLHQVWKWFISIVLIGIALIIGITRIILRVHYPTDVVAGIVLAIMWVLVSFTLLSRFRNQKPGDRG